MTRSGLFSAAPSRSQPTVEDRLDLSAWEQQFDVLAERRADKDPIAVEELGGILVKLGEPDDTLQTRLKRKPEVSPPHGTSPLLRCRSLKRLRDR